MVFFFGKTQVLSHVLQPDPHGPCNNCSSGKAALIEEERQFFAFCCIPLPSRKEQMVRCPNCKLRIRACYYYPPPTTVPEADVEKETEPPLVQGKEID